MDCHVNNANNLQSYKLSHQQYMISEHINTFLTEEYASKALKIRHTTVYMFCMLIINTEPTFRHLKMALSTATLESVAVI